MPVFQLTNDIPGIQFLDDPLSVSTSATQIKVRFTDGLLWMHPDKSLTLQGSHDGSNEPLVLTADFSAEPIEFLEGQFQLTTITLQIAVTDNGHGNKIFDPDAPTPVDVTGKVVWKSDMVATLLDDASGELSFNLIYSYQGNGQSGFQIELEATPSDPVSIERGGNKYVDLQSGSVRVDVLPEEAAMILTLKGDAALPSSSQFVTQAQSILETIFGTDDHLNLLDLKFVFRRKFKLRDTGLLGEAAGPPTLSIFPTWKADTAPSFDDDGLKHLAVSLGSLRLTFSLPEPGELLPELKFALQKSSIRFPDLPGLESLELTGNLDFEPQATGVWQFKFEPALAGTVVLPEILHFFLAQFTWRQGEIPFLEDLSELMQISQVEMDWYRFFQEWLKALDLTALDPDQFKADFASILAGAESVLAGAESILAGAESLRVERLFRLAFRALQSAGEQLFEKMWEVWFEEKEDDWDALLTLLPAVLADLNGGTFGLLLESMFHAFKSKSLDLDELLTALFVYGVNQIKSAFEAFMKLWLQMLGAAIRALNADELAESLWQVLGGAGGELARFRQLTELPPFASAAFLSSPVFSLRTDVLLLGLGLQSLVSLTNLPKDVLAFPDTGRFFQHIFSPVVDLFHTLLPAMPSLGAEKVLGLLAALFTNASGDEDKERLLLQLGRIFPLGILFALVGAVWNALRPDHLVPWARLVFNDIEADDTLKVLRLPPPQPSGPKYLIFSDVHRDAASDRLAALEFGSIDHFSVHSQLYLDILNYADGAGYTVIEAGDADELWFIRDFSDPDLENATKMLEKIMETHTQVYDKLSNMYSRDRYVRIIGNHDSPIRKPEVLAQLRTKFSDITLYDFAIIPGVKTMENSWSELLSPDRIDDWIGDRIGLDSEPYQEVKPLIIAHGHQWDFWNCDSNNLVGKLISNSVSVPLDMLDDPFIDMGGINYDGTALVNFRELFANLFVLNNFPSYQPARKFAHQIQHQKEGHRFPIDDLFFIETIPALVSYLTMPLRFSDEQGTEHTWDPDNLIANLAYLPGFLFNQLCLGHTHYPQAQPYFDIEGMLAGPLADVADDLRSTLAELLFGFELSLNFIRSHYYNSGTAGWHEGVIWAIEINEHGEARLVFWTEDTRLDRPQTMNWQLPRMEDALRRALEGKKEDFEDYLAQLGQLFGASLHEIVTNLGTAVTLPFALLLEHPDELDELVGQGINVDLSGMQQTIQAQWNQVTHWLLRFFLTLYRRLENASLEGQEFALSIPLPAELAAALANIQTLIQALPFPDVADDQLRERATELACIWLLANHSSGILDRSGRRTSLFRSTYPLAWMALALVAIMPGPGDDTLPPLPFTSSVTTETDQGKTTLKLTITINLDT